MADPVAKEAAAPAKIAHTTQIGDSGLKIYGGYLNEEFLRDLSGDKAMRVYREMENNDPTVRAIIYAITALVTGVEWSWKAADDSDEAEEAKTFLEEVFDDMETPLSDVIAEACTMFAYGFAPCEITYKPRAGEAAGEKLRSKFADGRFGLKSIALRAQNTIQRWEVDKETGEIKGLWQMTTHKGAVFIPIDKLCNFRTTSVKNNPQGASLLRGMYRSWLFKTKFEEIEGIGIERETAGIPVCEIPMQFFDPNATPEEKAVLTAYQRIATQIRTDQFQGLVMPSDPFTDAEGKPIAARKFNVRLMTSGGTRAIDVGAAIDRKAREIATSVLMDFLFLGQGSSGSFALSSDKTNLSAQAMGTFLRRIKDAINSQVVQRLWDLNGFDVKLMPKIEHGDLEKPDLAELSALVSTLVGAGAQMFVTADDQNFARKLAGFPPAPEEGLGDQGAPVSPDAPQSGAGGAAATVARVKKAIDDFDAGAGWTLPASHRFEDQAA